MKSVKAERKSVLYSSLPTQAYYGLQDAKAATPQVRSLNIVVESDDKGVRITDTARGASNQYQLVGEPGWQPFLLDPAAQFSTYEERGRVGVFRWTGGDGFPGSRNRNIKQLLVLGLRSDERTPADAPPDSWGFLRLFDFLGREPTASAYAQVLYSRGGGQHAAPSVETELVMEAGGPAALLGKRPDTIPGDTHAAVGYISGAGAAYYVPNAPSGQVPLGAAGQWLKICWTQRFLTHENAEVTVAPNQQDLVDEIFRRTATTEERFLTGYLRVYFFSDNPDPGAASTQPVHRTAVIGLTAQRKFGFLRIFDSLGGPTAAESQGPVLFDFFTSHDNSRYGRMNREMVLEAGSIDPLLG